MGRNAKGQFVACKVSCLTQEQKLKHARALSKSWMKRPDYIGDIKNENVYVFNCWRGFRYTVKGKKAGCSKEWEDYRTFYNDVRPSYEKGLVLRRKNTLLPWSKDNFIWVSPDDVGDLLARNTIEYKGKTLSLTQWCKELNISLSGLKMRYYRHKDEYTTEEILFGKKKNRNAKPIKGVNDSTTPIRSKASKMISAYKHKDLVNGVELCDVDIDWMIENILTKPCVYCGDTYRVGCDRIDNSKGHTKDNVVPCCIECNTARNNYFTYEEMKKLGRTIAEIKKERRAQNG